MQLEHYQTTFAPLLVGVALAILLTFFLKETGPAIQLPGQVAARGSHESNHWNRESTKRLLAQVPQP